MAKERQILTVIVSLTLLFCMVCGGCRTHGDGDDDKMGEGTINKISDEQLADMTKPAFSDLGGFYTGKMAVSISVPPSLENAASIRITFDGSEPNLLSRKYTGEDIIFPDAGCVKTAFSDDGQNVSVSVLRAACINNYGRVIGQIATATYIQIEESAAERFNMPVISLVTEEDNLTNQYAGILTNPGGKGSEWERPVNIAFFESDGTLAFVQDAGIRLFGGSSRALAQKSFRITARKSDYFDFDYYDGKGKFKYALFPGRLDSSGELLRAYDSIVLRNGGNDSILLAEDNNRITYMRDGLAAVIAQKAAPNVDAMAYRPVVVFLNGEYYGIMNMREYQNNKYLQNVYGIEDKEGITVISTEMDTSNGGRYDGTWFYFKQDDGPEGELEYFTGLLNDIVNGKYTYDEAAKLIDMDNFVKYCALNLFLCNTDWPHNNVKVWRYAGSAPGDAADTSVTDGKWRFMLKDADLGMGRYVCGAAGGYPIELYTKADSRNIRLMLRQYINFEDMSGYPYVADAYYPDALRIQGLFYFCMKNEGFTKSFTDYCEKLVSEIWTPEALESMIVNAAGIIESEMPNYLIKEFGTWQWHSTTYYNAWKDAVYSPSDSLISWAKDRSGIDGEFMKQVREITALINSGT